MGQELIKSYDTELVVLSFLIAVLASYVALDLAGRVLSAQGRFRLIWQWGGAIAMGTGIWSMHFIGMLACDLPITVHYNALPTFLSLIYAILASGLALWLLSQPVRKRVVLQVGGLCMGAAIAWMHYTGMAALQIQATLQYDLSLVVLSVAIAISAAFISLWLAVQLQDLPPIRRRWQKLCSAIVMGIAISGMHYIGMMATHVQPQLTPQPTLYATTLSQPLLATCVAIATLLILSLTLLLSLFDKKFAARRTREILLQENETKFRSLVVDMQVGVLLCDARANPLLSNPAALELLGLPPDLPKDLPFPLNLAFVHENGHPFQVDELPIQRAIAQCTAVNDVIMGLDLPTQGDRRWLMVSANPQLSSQGQVERVICTLSDISDRKRAEMAINQLADLERTTSNVIQHMRQTLDLQTIFNTTAQELQTALHCDRVLIYRFLPDWSGEFVSEAVAENWNPMLLRSQQDSGLTQNVVAEDNCITTKLVPSNPLISDTYLNTHAQDIYYQRGTYCCVPDVLEAGFDPCYLNLLEQLQARAYIIAPIFCGATLWGLLAIYQNSAPRRWHETEIQLVVKIANPLGVAVQQAELFAQTQQQAEALKYAKDMADAANRAKSEFLANMSHELRTPLNAILGFAQLMIGEPSLTLEHQQYVEIINQSGEHLLRLINDVLEMSKIEAGRVMLCETEFDLHKLLHRMEAMMHLKASSKGLLLHFDCDEAVPHYIKTDENKLRQVLLNLLSNGIKFTEQGSVTLRVRVNPAVVNDNEMTTGCCLVFDIKDTGDGIALDELDDLFQPFTQAKSGQRSQEGTGLGLHISERFVHLMGGEITVQSQLNVGSCFTFFIHAKNANTVIEPVTSLAITPRSTLSKRQHAFRILITEDNLTNRLLLNTMMRRLGFDVQEAVNGQEAIAVWQAWQPDLIFMDMQMPTLDGYTATRRIRQREQQIQDRLTTNQTGELAHESIAHTKIIALTASVFSEQRQEILDAGCDDVLSKPFIFDDMLKMLSTHLGISLDAFAEEGERSILQETQPLPMSLAMMPAAWYDQLYCAAAQGRDLESLTLIGQIPQEHTALAKMLNQWVKSYQFEQLLTYLQDVGYTSDTPCHPPLS